MADRKGLIAKLSDLVDLVAACRAADEARHPYEWGTAVDPRGYGNALIAYDAALVALGREWRDIATLVAEAQDDTDSAELDRITAYAKAISPSCHSVYEVLDGARPVSDSMGRRSFLSPAEVIALEEWKCPNAPSGDTCLEESPDTGKAMTTGELVDLSHVIFQPTEEGPENGGKP